MRSAFLSNLTIFNIFSGVGGQIDFLRGAALAHDGCGKPILALNSVTKKGESKIVPFLKEGKSNGCRMVSRLCRIFSVIDLRH